MKPGTARRHVVREALPDGRARTLCGARLWPSRSDGPPRAGYTLGHGPACARCWNRWHHEHPGEHPKRPSVGLPEPEPWPR